jgi:hypothetical protein
MAALFLKMFFSQSVEFISNLTGQKWILTNIFAPCTPDGKLEFLRWFRDIVMPDEQSRIIMVDFNKISGPENRNMLGVIQIWCWHLLKQ